MEETKKDMTMENTQEVQETKNNKLKDFGTKVGGLIKKNGKKIAAAAAVGAVALISYGLGVKKTEGEFMELDEEETTVETDNSDEMI